MRLVDYWFKDLIIESRNLEHYIIVAGFIYGWTRLDGFWWTLI